MRAPIVASAFEPKFVTTTACRPLTCHVIAASVLFDVRAAVGARFAVFVEPLHRRSGRRARLSAMSKIAALGTVNEAT